jgi:hypothetical protein
MARGNGMVAGRLPSLKAVTNFQHFSPDAASDMALALGRFCADLGAVAAADSWFAVAAYIATGKNPPNQQLEARVSKACRDFAQALGDHADEIDKQTEAQAKAMETARATAGKGSSAGIVGSGRAS